MIMKLSPGHPKNAPVPTDPFTVTVHPIMVVKGVIGYDNNLHTQPNYFCV